MEEQVMSREILSKKAFENWYFEYSEAEREFLDAKRSFEMKKRDICLFLFKAYKEWCNRRYGEVVRPEPYDFCEEAKKPIKLFLVDFGVGSRFQGLVTELLNQNFECV
jgi:hypothetical protein